MEDEIRKRMSERIEQEMLSAFGVNDSNKYTTGSTFSMEELEKTMDALLPKWESIELDNFMVGKKIENVVLVTPDENMKDVPVVMTKYGKLKIQFSKYIPDRTMYLMVVPEIMDYRKTFTPTE